MRTMCIFVSLLPLEVQSNLSISEAMFGIPTPPIRLRLRRFRTYNMKNKDVQACHLLLSVNFRPPPNPILIRFTNGKITFLLLTRQATAATAIMTPIITIAAIHKLAQSPGLCRWT